MNQIPYTYKRPGEDPKIPPSLIFFKETAERNKRASDENGAPMYDRVVYAEVMAPGQKNSVVTIEVKRKFAHDGSVRMRPEGRHLHELLDKWETKAEPGGTGTPLEQWPTIDIAQAETLRFHKVFTVQQLAELPDIALQHIGRGARELRAKAQAWLARAAGSLDGERMAARIAELETRLEQAEAQLRTQTQRQNNIGFERKQRGRPRKEVDITEEELDRLTRPDDDSSDDD